MRAKTHELIDSEPDLQVFISILYPIFPAVFVLITYTDRTSLYCSSEYLILFESGEAQLIGPTAFCTLAGQ